MDKISFVGSKGGVGTSTVAALHALSVAETSRRVRLTATATAGIEDLAVLLAVPVPAPGQVVAVTPALSLGDEADLGAYTVVDGSTDAFSRTTTVRSIWSCATTTCRCGGPCWRHRLRRGCCWWSSRAARSGGAT